MTARRVFVGGRSVDVAGSGYAPLGTFNPPLAGEDALTRLLLTAGVACSDAVLHQDGERWVVRGDPTEGALIVLAAKAGLEPERVRVDTPRIQEQSPVVAPAGRTSP